MSRPLALALLLAAAAAGPARGADEHVPAVPAEALPVAGTCAPMPAEDATVVTVGDVGWYRVSGRPGEVDYPTLASVLTERSGVAQDGTSVSRHSVWVVARGDQPLRPVLNVLILCSTAGIFRVGLQVRSESGEGVMGFPLFLPPRSAASPGADAPKARRLDVRVEANAETPADPRVLYEAGRRAVERFAPVVAVVSVHGAVRLQDAVSSLDMLWRSGVAAVQLSWRGLPPRWQGHPGLKLIVEGRELSAAGADFRVPAIRARSQPWPDEGAAQPGALSLALEELPGEDAAAPAEDPRRPLPNYARVPDGPPTQVLRRAEATLLGWARAVAADLARATRGEAPAPGRLVVRIGRDAATTARALAPARDTFADAEQVVPATLHTAAYLFRGARPVGKVDVTLNLAGPAPGVIFASWVPETFPSDLTLPPEAVDPFAGGVAGALRVWIEGVLASARKEGVVGVPLAPEREVLQQLPAVAHAGVKPRLDARVAGLENLVGWLRATPYDRVLLLPPDGTTAVWARGVVAGILRLSFEAEETDLRIRDVAAKAAPR